MTFAKILTAVALSAGLATAAAAQTQGGAAMTAPAGARPETKQVGDWTVRCFPVQSPAPCDMYQEMADKNTRQMILSISLAFVPASNRHAIQVQVPLGVSVPKGVVLQTDSYTSPALPYRRCDRAGCYAIAVVDSAVIDGLAHSGPQARAKIVADGGKTFDLVFSLNGFSSAHDTMADLAKQKAKAPAPAPATVDASQPAPAPAP